MEPVVFRTGKSRLPLLQLPPGRLNNYNNYNSGFLSSYLSPLSSILPPPQARLPLPRPHHRSASQNLVSAPPCSGDLPQMVIALNSLEISTMVFPLVSGRMKKV